MLLEAALGVDRTALYLMAQEQIPPNALEAYDLLLARRLTGEPVQHIVGWAPFFGRKFIVGKGVFIPRFDSEIIVEKALERVGGRSGEALEILDLCCGCGAIGLTLAAELPQSRVTLADNDLEALRYTTANICALGLNERAAPVNWDALTSPPAEWFARFDLVVANPPYIPLHEVDGLHPDVRDGEPHAALTDGGDGLTFYRKWAETVPLILKPGGVFLTEIGDGLAESVLAILADNFVSLKAWNDLSGCPRMIEASAFG